MSVSKVYYALMDDKNTIYKNVKFGSDHIIFYARLKQKTKCCPQCKSFNVRIKETKERTFRMNNLGSKRSYLKINVYKIWCQDCDKKAWIDLPFTYGKFPMTRSFVCFIIQLAAITTLLHVALFLGLQWKSVKNIDKENLRKKSKQFSFRKLRYISIDEIAIKKGHKYMTIITDILTGQIIHAVEGRGEEDLRPFLKLLSKKAKRLMGVGIDMSVAYSSAVMKNLPNVAIIYDRFHVTKLLNKTIDDIRRAEYAKYQNNGLRVLKGQRFLLLRNFADLDHGEKSSLKKLLEVNESLAMAHTMKEQFRMFWDCDSKKEGARFLVRWIIEAMESGLAMLAKTARTLVRHYLGLLSYFEHRIDNGKAEGVNNKIKVLKRQAYGYRDQDYFKLKLYNLHKKEFELVG